ncbi:MAG: multiheme c-type cytochrome [Deltaproteobacteria bacterium]
MKKNLIYALICLFLCAVYSSSFAADEGLPLPLKSYHKRNAPVTEKWKEAGRGYSNPYEYKPPRVEGAGPDCIKCHKVLTPVVVKDWEDSKHFKKDVGCANCHNDHSNLIMPTPDTCGKCHAARVMQHKGGKHGVGWKNIIAVGGKSGVAGRYLAQYSEMQEGGCGTCHSIENKCDSCHTRHAFKPKEAREPDACGTCHMGPDHAQLEYYESSKHGVIFKIEGKGFEDGGRVPTCVTCHMSGGNHDVSQGITIGGASQGKFIGQTNSGHSSKKSPSGIFMNEITGEDFTRERGKMLRVCINCHSNRFAEHKLSVADGVKIASDAVVGEGIKEIEDLYNLGLLNPMPDERPENPFSGYNLLLTSHQLYEQTSGIEALFFEMYKFDLVHTWKGAYHFSPDYTHWYGNAPMKLKLSRIKDEANKLRRLNKLELKLNIAPEKVEFGE